MLFNCVVIIAKKQTAYCNPFRPVETRSDLLKPVETRFNPFRLTRLNMSKHVWTCWNTFQSVQINPFEPVETRFNPFRSVQTRFQASPPPLLHPPSPFSPLLPLFPFLWGGRGGNTITKNPPEGGGGGRSPPPPPLRILTTTTKNYQNSRTLSSSNLQNLCNLPLLPPRGFSLSPLLLLLKTT